MGLVRRRRRSPRRHARTKARIAETTSGLPGAVDNFERADGYSDRFGLHCVDYATQKRTLKLGAQLYKDVIGRNAVL